MEYDLNFSTVTLGVLCLKSINVQGRAVSSSCIELTAKPTAIVWHPKLKGDLEDRYDYLLLYNINCTLYLSVMIARVGLLLSTMSSNSSNSMWTPRFADALR